MARHAAFRPNAVRSNSAASTTSRTGGLLGDEGAIVATTAAARIPRQARTGSVDNEVLLLRRLASRL